jgi:superfamily II DNA helicase RecQ
MWQVDICEAILLGLDCILIAPTGAGKTMPFIMPLLVDKTCRKMVIIISPLNELEYDQVRSLDLQVTFSCERLQNVAGEV